MLGLNGCNFAGYLMLFIFIDMNGITSSVFFGAWSLFGGGKELSLLVQRYLLSGNNFDAGAAERRRMELSAYLVSPSAAGGKMQRLGNYNPSWSIDVEYWKGAVDEDGFVMVLPVKDVLTKESQGSGNVGMDDMSRALEWAYGNDSVSAVVLDVYSPGGSVHGTEGFGNMVAKNDKPVVAFGNDLVASAAYWVSCGAEWFIASGDNARIGSIGAYLSFLDDRAWQAKEGVSIIDVYADGSDLKNVGIREYEDSGKVDVLRGEVNRYRDSFVSHVKSARGDRLKWQDNDSIFRGAMFDGRSARRLGLVDELGSFSYAIEVAMKRAKKRKKMSNSVLG